MKKAKATAIRCYVHGVEVNRIRPRLEFLDDDDWFDKFVLWTKENHKDDDIFAVMDKDPIQERRDDDGGEGLPRGTQRRHHVVLRR